MSAFHSIRVSLSSTTVVTTASTAVLDTREYCGRAAARRQLEFDVGTTVVEANARRGGYYRAGDHLAVEASPVATAQVLDVPGAVLGHNADVTSRDFGIIDMQLTRFIPADGKRAFKALAAGVPAHDEFGRRSLWRAACRSAGYVVVAIGRARLTISGVALNAPWRQFVQPGEQCNNGQESQSANNKPANRFVGKTKGWKQLCGSKTRAPRRYGVEAGYAKYFSSFEFVKERHGLGVSNKVLLN